mmetsp:Transcript_7817/g.11348  ORF Transcript_7817/g.11348 Transcript_7817/m.11348 type:complete len:87 (+) Transcript_7817:265-525(+)
MKIPLLKFKIIALAIISLYAVVVNIAVPIWRGTISSILAGVSSNFNTTSTTATGTNDVVGTDGGALKQQEDDLIAVLNAGTKQNIV